MTAPTCAAILRASAGPCEFKGGGITRCNAEPNGHAHTNEGYSFFHVYLGPRAGVCGHVEEVHREEVHAGTEHHVPAHCESCWNDDSQFVEDRTFYHDHAFTEEAADA